MKTNHFIILLCCLALSCCQALAASSASDKQQSCPLVRVEVERLPDLNIPRYYHDTFCYGDEIITVGGHTSGFVPTETAERYHDGRWEQIPTTYSHAGGLFFKMRSGKLILAGGFEKPLGIGQTFNVEEYDSATGVFTGFGCLDMKRAFATAIELDSGKVLISGNWYADDCMEIFDSREETFTFAKSVSMNRCSPYIFRIAANDAVVFGCMDNKGRVTDTVIVDRLLGDPFTVPLFKTWKPFPPEPPEMQPADAFIGNEQKGIFAYLFPVVNKDGQLAIAQLRSICTTKDTPPGKPVFSLLPTDYPVPMKTVWSRQIIYYGGVHYDGKSKKAYMCGIGDDIRYYVLCIDCAAIDAGGRASLTLFYTDVFKNAYGFGHPVLNEDGNMVVVGGTVKNNYSPSALAMILHLNQQGKAAGQSSRMWRVWGIMALTLIAVAVAVLVVRRRRTPSVSDIIDEEGKAPFDSIESDEGDIVVQDTATTGDEELMRQVVDLMEKERLYLNSGLTVNDVAMRLGVHRNQVSHCVNTSAKSTFSQFINGYRIQYAQQLLRTHPDMKMTAVYTDSGFSSEASFFRAFKALTGKTPREWMGQ